MTLSELQEEVYAITNRPDLASRTASAIRNATLKLHNLDYFYKDLYENGVDLLAPAYLHEVDYRVIFPRFRALKYIRKADSVTGEGLGFLEVIPPELVLDSYGLNRNDVCYVAGDVWQIRSSTEFQYALVGVYLTPEITVANYSSWIANDFPFCIVHEAAVKIMTSINKLQEVAYLTRELEEQKRQLIASNIQAVGS